MRWFKLMCLNRWDGNACGVAEQEHMCSNWTRTQLLLLQVPITEVTRTSNDCLRINCLITKSSFMKQQCKKAKRFGTDAVWSEQALR